MFPTLSSVAPSKAPSKAPTSGSSGVASSTIVGVAAGSAVGGAALVAVALGYMFWSRRRSNAEAIAEGTLVSANPKYGDGAKTAV